MFSGPERPDIYLLFVAMKSTSATRSESHKLYKFYFKRPKKSEIKLGIRVR